MENVKMILGGKAFDDRGSLLFVNDFDFHNVKRFYIVSNYQQNFIRAWHGHRYEGKYVLVVSGTALVGVVSLETEEIVGRYVLTEEQPKVLWIPPNHANGFMTLRRDTKVMFFSTSTLEESKGDDIRFPHDKWNIWNIDYR